MSEADLWRMKAADLVRCRECRSVMVLLREWWWENGPRVQEPLKWLITVRTENNSLWPVTLSFSQCMIHKPGESSVLASSLTRYPSKTQEQLLYSHVHRLHTSNGDDNDHLLNFYRLSRENISQLSVIKPRFAFKCISPEFFPQKVWYIWAILLLILSYPKLTKSVLPFLLKTQETLSQLTFSI